MAKEIGEIETVPYEIKQIEWRFPDFFAAVEDQNNYHSPAFSLVDCEWYLSVWPNGRSESEKFIELFLRSKLLREYSVEYYFGLKKCYGNVEQSVSGVMKECEKCSPVVRLIEKAELLRRKSELMSGNVLTIMCTLKLVTQICNSSQPTTILEETKPQKLISMLLANILDFYIIRLLS